MSPYENQVVIITGGSSGIGRSAALAFAQKGAPCSSLAAGGLRWRRWPQRV
jgi:NAD(P)-dependent dehydrogenase (short-subunit alcohol dehydrogenase family)